MEPYSNIQLMCHCLNLTQPIPSIDAFLNTVRGTSLPRAQCINLINIHIVGRIQTPNFYLINAFVDLAADQLRRLLKSPYFSVDEYLTL